MSEWLGPLCAFGSSVTWTLGSAAYARLAERHGAFAVNFARASIALPLFVIAAFVVEGSWTAGLAAYGELGSTQIGWLGISMFSSYAFGDAVFLWSCQAIGIPAALAIASAYPLWTALAGMFFRGEWLRFAQWMGLFITVAGVAVVILSGARASSLTGELHRFRKGALLATLTSLFWALNSYAVAEGARGLSTPVGNTVRMMYAIGLIWIMKRVFASRASLRLPVPELRRWAPLIALEAFGGSFLFMYGLSHSSLAIAAALSSLSPVLSVPLAWSLRLEPMCWMKATGIVAVVGGIVLLLQG